MLKRSRLITTVATIHAEKFVTVRTRLTSADLPRIPFHQFHGKNYGEITNHFGKPDSFYHGGFIGLNVRSSDAPIGVAEFLSVLYHNSIYLAYLRTCFEHAAVKTFRAVNAHGLKGIVELPETDLPSVIAVRYPGTSRNNFLYWSDNAILRSFNHITVIVLTKEELSTIVEELYRTIPEMSQGGVAGLLALRESLYAYLFQAVVSLLERSMETQFTHGTFSVLPSRQL